MENKKLIRWPKLVLGTAALLFAGVIYAWSILKAPLAAEFGWTPANLAFNFTLTLCFFALGGLVSGLASKKTSPKLRMAVSAVLVFAGFFIASRLSGDSLLPLYLAYGVMGGLGIGITYNTVISVTSAWFPDKKGLCTGVMMMGFGFSTLILGKLAGNLIGMPDVGWRTTYVVLAVVIGAVLLLTGLLIKLPPADAAFGRSAVQKQPETATAAKVVKAEYSAPEMVRRASFWKLFLFFILLSSVGSTAISFARDYIVSLGIEADAAVTLVGILSICNGLGRLCSGWLFDTLGLRKTQLITSAVVIAAPVLALLAILTSSAVIGIVGLCLCGFSYGFSPTVTAAFVSAFYGPKNFALNFSIMNLVLVPASFTSTLAGSLVTSTGSYISTFIVLILFSVVGLIDNISIKKA